MSSKRVVAHLVRHYLAPTETFIGNQIFSLRNFRPIVITRQSYQSHGFILDDIFCAMEILKGFHKTHADLSYTFFKQPTRKEVNLLSDIIFSNEVKLLHFHYAVDARYFLNLKRTTKLPSIVSCYGYDVSSFAGRYLGYGKRYLRPIFSEMDIFLVMSEDMRQDLMGLGCPEEKIITHYYGIEAERFACPERCYENKSILNILMCGTLEIKKAQHLVLKALRRLETEGRIIQKFRITIVGNGPMRKHLEHMVQDFGWQDRVIFTGYIPYQTERFIKMYWDADIFALPSMAVKRDKEGIPGTIVEAMASGLPIVTTYHAGIPEVIENGKHGILVQEGDIEGLSGALRKLIESRALREQLGYSAAKRAIREFNVRERIKYLEKIYESLIQ